MLHKFFSSVLALFVLISAFSFRVETRQCSVKSLDTIVASKVKSCCNPLIDSPFAGLENACCKGKVVSIDGLSQVELILASSDLPTLSVFDGFLKSYSSTNFVDFQSSQSVSHPKYTPPDLVYKLQVEYQAFLI